MHLSAEGRVVIGSVTLKSLCRILGIYEGSAPRCVIVERNCFGLNSGRQCVTTVLRRGLISPLKQWIIDDGKIDKFQSILPWRPCAGRVQEGTMV